MKTNAKEWLKRYLPAEITCTITALVSATIVFLLTGNRIATAFFQAGEKTSVIMA